MTMNFAAFVFARFVRDEKEENLENSTTACDLKNFRNSTLSHRSRVWLNSQSSQVTSHES